MPPLETDRLLVRPFTPDDLESVHRLLDVELAPVETDAAPTYALDERRRWLQWTILSYEQLAILHQPPYGDRAIVLKESGRLVGACGLTPCLDAFGQLPLLASEGASRLLTSAEVGLFWAVARPYQRQGYATEAARALIDYAFTSLQLARIVATTTYDNEPSIAVMRKLGMRIGQNPFPDPPWLQVVGLLANTGAGSGALF